MSPRYFKECAVGMLSLEGVCGGEWGLGAGEMDGLTFVWPKLHLPFGLPPL